MASSLGASRMHHEVGLLDDTLSVPTEEALIHLQSEALRQAAVSRRGSLHPGRGKWQV
jgi:hypothetical protein